MAALATIKGVSIAPRKVGIVAALVRGRTVADALVILNHTQRRSAVAVRKAIESAAANASAKDSLNRALIFAASNELAISASTK